MSLTQADTRSKSLPRTAATVGVVLVHLAVFYALTIGRPSITITQPLKDAVTVFIPLERPPTPQPKITPPKAHLERSVPTPTPEQTPIVPEVPLIQGPNDNTITTETVPDDSTPGTPPNSFAITRRVDPQYPSASRRAGEQGTVLLAIVIGADGKPVDVSVAKSSGFSALDDSAVNAVRQWRFTTNVSGQARVTVPVTFRLQNVR